MIGHPLQKCGQYLVDALYRTLHNVYMSPTQLNILTCNMIIEDESDHNLSVVLELVHVENTQQNPNFEEYLQ
jgi:hypothetical protein